MANGPVTSWSMDTADYLGHRITATVAFNAATGAITNPGLTGDRDPECLYDLFIVGRPDTGAVKTFVIPAGSFSVNRQQLSAQGFDTISDVVNANSTFDNSAD